MKHNSTKTPRNSYFKVHWPNPKVSAFLVIHYEDMITETRVDMKAKSPLHQGKSTWPRLHIQNIFQMWQIKFRLKILLVIGFPIRIRGIHVQVFRNNPTSSKSPLFTMSSRTVISQSSKTQLRTMIPSR